MELIKNVTPDTQINTQERFGLPPQFFQTPFPNPSGKNQNGYFTPLPYKTKQDYQKEFLSALVDMSMKRDFDNKIKNLQDGRANDVFERMAQQFNERGAPAYEPDLNNPLLQDPRNALYKQQANDVFNRMAKQFNERGAPKQANVATPTSKPGITPESVTEKASSVGKAKTPSQSSEAQAKLNSAEWLKNYRQMMEQSGPEVSDVNMRDQIAVAMRDPVYGQATATGLAAGQNMLNSWIAGANSKSRANREKLANERWIRQMETAEEDKQYNRRVAEEERKYRKERDALSDRRYNEQAYLVESEPVDLQAFREKGLMDIPGAKEDIETLGKTKVYSNAVDAAKDRSEKRAAAIRLRKAQDLATPDVLMMPKNELESTRSFGNLWERGRGAIFGGWGSPILMDRKDAANAKMMSTMAKNKYKKFSRFSLEDLEQDIQGDVTGGRLNTALQKRKILNLMQALKRRGFRSAAVSPDGQMFVFASPSESVTITPNTVDSVAKEFEVSLE